MECPDCKIGLYEDFKDINEIRKEDVEKFDIVLLPNWCIEKFQGGFFDLFINIGSLSEMDIEIISNYVSIIEKITNGIVYMVNRNKKVKEFGTFDVPVDNYPFSSMAKVIGKKYDPGCDLYHGLYGIYRANLWEIILKCEK